MGLFGWMPDFRDFLVPSRDWRVRVYVLYTFIFLDYILTSAYIDSYTDEGNAVLRAFMTYFDSVTLSLLAFTLAFYGPIYLALCHFSNRDWRRTRASGTLELLHEYRRPLYDIFLGLGVAARHFEGGLSWILPLSNRLWLALGFIAYLTLVHIGTLRALAQFGTRVGGPQTPSEASSR
jgi:hypothetical protein